MPGIGMNRKAGTGSNFAAFAKLRACPRFALRVDQNPWNLRSHYTSFGVNGEWSPLAFEDNYFDAVYAVSVFTHLD